MTSSAAQATAATPRRDKAGGRPVPLALRAAGAFLALLVLAWIVEPVSVSYTALAAMLPYMAILGVAAIGQHLVILQRGLDISVAGTIAMAAAVVTSFSTGATDIATVALAVVLALGAGVAAGTINGIVVGIVRVPPLVTTIATNSLLLGCVLYLTGGSPSTAAPMLSSFALGRSFGLPNTFLVMAVLAAVATFALALTPAGRRFVAAGINPGASAALGVPVRRYVVATYALSGLGFAASGVLLAGLVGVPNLFCGDPYMLSTIAAVVVGGTSLSGGQSSILATIIGAAFLTFLNQLVLTLGFETSMQFVLQAAVVLLGVSLQQVRSIRRRG